MQELAFGKQEVDFEKGADNRHIKGRVRLNVGQRMSIHLSAADMVNRILPHSLYIWMS